MTDHEDAVDEHDPGTRMDAHTSISDDDHGHAEGSLGRIDWGAWGLAILGGLTGVVVLAGFWLALS